MNIKELEDKHYHIWDCWRGTCSNEDLHTKLSIQFAIEVLEEVSNSSFEIYSKTLNDKIQELKQYLDE